MGSELTRKDELFQLLSNRRRRYAFHACKQADVPVTLSDLAEQVAAWEYEKEISEVTSQERRRVYTSMQQTHLPAMEAAGIVEFEDHEIELTDRASELELYLDVVPEDSIPWGEYYLGLSVLAAALLAAVWFEVYPRWIPELAWGGLVVGAFLCSSAVHVWLTRRHRLGAGDRPPGIDSA